MPYTCPKCGMTSHNPEDEKSKYCGNCHTFEPDCFGLIGRVGPVQAKLCAGCSYYTECVKKAREVGSVRDKK